MAARVEREGNVGATRGRRVAGVTNLLLSSLLVLGILMMLNYLSFRHYGRWDWTSQGIYTLSDRTEQELRTLADPVDIYLFMSEGEPHFPEVNELLERYRSVSSRITVHHVDPDRNASEYQILAQRFGLSAAMLESGEMSANAAAVVTRGERRWTITRDDLVGIDASSFDDGDDGPKVDVKAEQALTGAIVQVTRGRPTKVCVSTGHGEWSLRGAERSLYALQDELRRENVEMEEVETLGASTIPASCDALFVVAPARAFTDADAGVLRRYLDAGGNILLALDPVIDGDRVQPTGLEGILGELHIRVDASVVLEVDPSRLLPPGNPAGPFVVASYGEHRSTEALAAIGGGTLFALSRSVRPEDGSDATTLLLTSDAAWAETDLSQLASDREPEADGEDIRGPVSLAVALQLPRGPAAADEGDDQEPTGGRLVVVGDADWLQSQPLRDPRFANYDLASSLVGWLTEREALIAISPKRIDAEPMRIMEDDLGDLLFRLLVLMPGAVLLLGFATWWSRRS